MQKPRLAYIAQFAQPGSYDKSKWVRVLGGDDETIGFAALLEAAGLRDEFEYVGVAAHEGEDISLDYDVAVLGGSFASVHDNHPWQREIQSWLIGWRLTGKPLLGICGGHQQMATVLGGQVLKRPEGPVVGSLPVTRTQAGRAHWLFEGFDDEAPFFFGNFDHVATAPPGATVLATRPALPCAALDYGGGWVSVQFHPETTCDRMATCWAELDPTQSRRYSFIPNCQQMVENFLRYSLGPRSPA
jgi:GMP synthase-like glutamine amidotransferase